MGASVIIAAAGNALRMQGTDKLFYRINDKEILLYSVEAFLKAECVDKIIVVTSAQKIEKVTALLLKLNSKIPIETVAGGKTRQQSVFNGICKCCETSQCVMIHDAARPMITAELINEIYKKVVLDSLGAAALGVRVNDTIKRVSDDKSILETVPREHLYSAQTPQCFDMALYKRACENAKKSGKDYTDDCQLVESIGKKVYIIDGDYRNIKITTPEDLIVAAGYLKEQK